MSSRARKPTKKALAATAAAAAAAAAVEETAPVAVVEPPPPVLEVSEAADTEPVPPLPLAPPPAKKPRNTTKKTPPVVAIVTPSGITGTFLAEQRPLIAHLPITSAEITFETSNFLKGGEDVAANVGGFDKSASSMSYLEGVVEGAAVSNTILATPKETATALEQKCKLPTHYSEKLMVLFQDSNRYKKLPEKTEIACFWCCHSFALQPVAIPSHILDEVWHMYGNFCSPECATAYLFKERIDSHVQWERYALLNSLYAEDAEVGVGAPRGVRPAPPREVLRMFGGSMDISEFRALVHEKRLRMDVLTPPMVSIIQTMDTKPIDFYDQNLKNVFIRNDIQHKYNAPGAQGLRLRRTKPVKNRESTVEWAMQITEVTA